MTAPEPLGDAQRHRLLQSALDARQLSYSPYSHFRVGASLLLTSASDSNGNDDGEAGATLVQGANVENASYPAGICAERAAFMKAVTASPASATGQVGIRAIAVAADTEACCAPCGICRQVMREFCEPKSTLVYLISANWTPANDVEEKHASGSAYTYLIRTLEELLPLSFGPEDLGGKKRVP